MCSHFKMLTALTVKKLKKSLKMIFIESLAYLIKADRQVGVMVSIKNMFLRQFIKVKCRHLT